jgi:hypothetical protein
MAWYLVKPRGNFFFTLPRRVRWTGHVAQIGEMTNAYTVLVGNLTGRGVLRDLDVKDNIKIYFEEIECKNAVGIRVT